METGFDPQAIWRALPADLKSGLRARPTEPLTDELLGKASQIHEHGDVPVFWQLDSDTFQYRLHPGLIEYLRTATR